MSRQVTSTKPGKEQTPLPVGLRVLRSADEASDVSVYRGVSYCDAVRRAGEGEAQRVLPGSIEVCGWSPVVLGLKAPENRFEEGLAPRLQHPIPGLLLAPLGEFRGEPDVVLARESRNTLARWVAKARPERLWQDHGGQLDRSALTLFANGQSAARRWLISAVNTGLAPLARSEHWQALTQRLFRDRRMTAAFEALISRVLADMSVCRNSSVIPLLTGQANVSFFCTGGITWGRNRASHLTSGWPYELWIDVTTEGDRTQ
jgi:hypothetical protein